MSFATQYEPSEDQIDYRSDLKGLRFFWNGQLVECYKKNGGSQQIGVRDPVSLTHIGNPSVLSPNLKLAVLKASLHKSGTHQKTEALGPASAAPSTAFAASPAPSSPYRVPRSADTRPSVSQEPVRTPPTNGPIFDALVHLSQLLQSMQMSIDSLSQRMDALEAKIGDEK